MAKTAPPLTWKNGFAQPTTTATWAEEDYHTNEFGEASHYVVPPSEEPLTSTVHNSFGLNVLRTWPTLYNGTQSPHGIPDWWQPAAEVDVLISGGKCLPSSSVNTQLISICQLAPLAWKWQSASLGRAFLSVLSVSLLPFFSLTRRAYRRLRCF